MKNALTVTFLIAVLILGCSTTDDSDELSNNECRLTGFNTALLYFSDEESNHSPNQIFNSSINKVYLEYNNSNKISKVVGGLASSPNGYLLVDIENNISYTNNKIYVENKKFSITEPFITSFEIDNNNLISREVTGYSPFLGDKYYSYEYVDGTINEYQEYEGNNILKRTFYFFSGNLNKVDIFQYDWDGELAGKKEVLFEDYDNSENLLKGYYYIPFAFYNSFSNNNFQTVRLNYYTYDNNEFVFGGETFFRTFNFQSNLIQQEGLYEESCN